MKVFWVFSVESLFYSNWSYIDTFSLFWQGIIKLSH